MGFFQDTFKKIPEQNDTEERKNDGEPADMLVLHLVDKSSEKRYSHLRIVTFFMIRSVPQWAETK